MNPLTIGILWSIIGYLAGFATPIILAQRIKSRFGEEGAKKLTKK